MHNSRTAVLLDRHPMWLDAVEQVLTKIQIEVRGRSNLLVDLVALVTHHQPDLLVADLELTDSDNSEAIDALREAHARVPMLKSVVVSALDQPKQVEAAFSAGAVAFVAKRAHPEDLSSAVRQVFDHSIYFAGQAQPIARVAAPTIEDATVLTRRELEILQLVAEGKSNAQVGRTLWVTEQTVKFHLSNIYRKLDVSNRTEASRWAQTRNLLSVPEPAARAV
jgi:DNA-binding NarL/FixJ family response regulator